MKNIKIKHFEFKAASLNFGFDKSAQVNMFKKIKINKTSEKVLKCLGLHLKAFEGLQGYSRVVLTANFLRELLVLLQQWHDMLQCEENLDLFENSGQEDVKLIAHHIYEFAIKLLKSANNYKELKCAYHFVSTTLDDSLKVAPNFFGHEVVFCSERLKMAYQAQVILEAESATLIQRAFRQRKFKSDQRKGTINTPKQKDWPCSQMVAKLNKAIPHKKPKPVLFLNQEQKNSLISNGSIENRDFFKKIARFAQYVNFDNFLDQLKRVVEKFNLTLHGLPKNQRAYVIVIPSLHTVPKNFGIPLKSNAWATLLSLDFLAQPPEGILIGSDSKKIELELQTNYPDVHNIFMIDDAIYSGSQMNENILMLRGADIKLRVFVLVPFYNYRGLLSCLRPELNTNYLKQPCLLDIIPLVGAPMYFAKDLKRFKLWSSQDTKSLKELNELSFLPDAPLSKVGVYFQHKIADEVSCLFNGISDFKDSCAHPNERIAFIQALIPQTPVPPYKLKLDESKCVLKAL